MKKIIKLLVVALFISFCPISVEASSNPQRVFGNDRVETSVRVSQKTYQNSSNTVILAGYDGQVDSLSGTILASFKDAPMLLTRKKKLDDITLKEIKRLKAKEIYILGGENVISKDVEDSLSDYEVTRISGKKREETAINIAQEVVGESVDEVFLTLGYDEYADALAIGPVSGKQRKPIFLTKTNKLPENTKNALKSLNVKRVTIIGGNTVVNESVEKELKDMNISFDRVFGKNRMETALNIAKKYNANPNSIIVANGYNYADAVIGGYFAAKENAPILLSKDKAIDLDSLGYIASNKKQTYVLGGESVISNDVFVDINLAFKDPIELKALNIDGTGENFTPHKVRAETNIVDEVVYKFFLKHENDERWTALQDYTKKPTIDWVPTKEGNYDFKVKVKYENSKRVAAEEDKTIKIDPLKPAKINSLELEGNRYEKNNQTIIADARGTNSVLYKFYIQDKKTGNWTVIQDYGEKPTANWRPEKHGKYRYLVRVKDINSDKERDDLLGHDVTINPPINYTTSHYKETLNEAVSKQTGTIDTGSNKISASKKEIEKYLNPKNYLQFEPKGANGEMMPLIAVEVKINSLNVRSEANPGSKILTSVKNGDVYIVLDEKNSWYKINAAGKVGWISGEYAEYVNDVPKDMYQFMVLSGQAGVTIPQMNKELKGMGILEGHGAAFIEGSKRYNVNELYLMSHSFLETARGRSNLASGIVVSSVDGKPVPPKKVYNMYGIGAKNQAPDRLGSETAYKEGWFTPEIAIREGAKWISEGYINHPVYKQDTLYKMRFYPENLGHWHKYATDVGWAVKQTSKISEIMGYAKNMEGVVLKFDIPKYRE